METASVSRRARYGGLVALPLAGLLGFAAVAYACVPQAGIRLSTPSGPVGTSVTVTGTNFTPGAAVSVYWGGLSGQLVGTSTGLAGGTITPVSFKVPAGSANGNTIVAAKQVKDGAAIGNPANVLFMVNTPGGTTPAPASNVQEEPASTDGAAGLAPAAPPAAQPAATATPAPAPVRAPVRSTATARAPRPAVAAPAPAATPAPVAAPEPAPAAPAPVEAAPAPAVTPEPAAPATAPARRSVMVSMASADDGSPALAIALVGVGLVLALGATALVLAGRRDRKAPAKAQR